MNTGNNRMKNSDTDNLITNRKTKLSLAVAAAMSLVSTSALSGVTLEEVVVTAQKREQSLIEVPYSISAVSGDAIDNAGATSLEDLARLVPGLAMANAGAKSSINNNMILRGINIGSPAFNNAFQNVSDAPVSTYFGEIPLFAGIKLVDLQRVEVLRGPQGTLYGSGSVGGTVRFLFNQPDTQENTGKLSARISDNAHSDEMNYNTDFIGNLAVNDSFAIRVAAGIEQVGGGVTDALGRIATDSTGLPLLSDPSDFTSGPVIDPKKDSDSQDSWYLRASALWNVGDDTDVLLTVFHQETEADGDTLQGLVDTGEGDEVVAGKEWTHNQRVINDGQEYDTDLVSLEIVSDLGFATGTSATGYTETQKKYQNDLSGLYQSFDNRWGDYFGYPRITAPSPQEDNIKIFTQELRLATQNDGNWDVVGGLFYKKMKADVAGNETIRGLRDWTEFVGETPVDDRVFFLSRDVDYDETALFGEFTYRITDKWQVTAGARVFWQNFEQEMFNFTRWGGDTNTANETDVNDQIYKFNTSYMLSEDQTVYVTWAEGFRHGGANALATGVDIADEFQEYEPDKATNYELGLKGELMDGRIRYSTAIYRVDWEKPQTDGFFGPLFLPGVFNAEEARTQGIELEVTAQVTEQLMVTAGYNYVDAEFTKDLSGIAEENIGSIAKGDPLPGVPENMASLSLDYYVPLESSSEIHINFNGSYRSSVANQPNENFRDYGELDGFSIWNVKVDWSNEQFTLGAFVNNIGDEEAATGLRHRQTDRGFEAFDDRLVVGRPRSIGMFASYSF